MKDVIEGNRPFELKDIEDVRILIKAKGKHYGIVPKDKDLIDLCREIRISLTEVLIDTHCVVDMPLEDLNTIKPKAMSTYKDFYCNQYQITGAQCYAQCGWCKTVEHPEAQPIPVEQEGYKMKQIFRMAENMSDEEYNKLKVEQESKPEFYCKGDFDLTCSYTCAKQCEECKFYSQ